MATRGTPRSHQIPQAFTVAVGRGQPQQELTSFNSVGVTMNLVDGDMIQFGVDGRSPEAAIVDELATDVWLDGLVRQRFRINSIQQQWTEHGLDVASVTALSYKRLLGSRLVGPGGLSFTGVDQGDIVWGLINHAQSRTNGSWGITKGSSTTGIVRTRNYHEGDNVGDQAKNMQEVIDGCWWDVDADLVYRALMLDTVAISPTPIAMGVNALRMTRSSSSGRFGNVAYADGGGDTVPVWHEATDLATDPRGRWEVPRGFPTTTTQATLVDSAAAVLDEISHPLSTWHVELEPSRYLEDSMFMPGDRAVVVIPPTVVAPFGHVPATRVVCQVTEVVVTVSGDGDVAVRLALAETRQEPPV